MHGDVTYTLIVRTVRKSQRMKENRPVTGGGSRLPTQDFLFFLLAVSRKHRLSQIPMILGLRGSWDVASFLIFICFLKNTTQRHAKKIARLVGLSSQTRVICSSGFCVRAPMHRSLSPPHPGLIYSPTEKKKNASLFRSKKMRMWCRSSHMSFLTFFLGFSKYIEREKESHTYSGHVKKCPNC